ncbi:MAG: hypothetical protein HZA77_03240 [Candidatus Schekmanbacteria bacterium]|nr:hypothetical protein [Candidatus Schekmanbacteria bacterium]
MGKLALKKESLDLVKAGLEIEKNILKLSVQKYQSQLRAFEKKHKLSSEEFIKKFKEGKLGDDEEWFDWLFAYKAVNHSKQKISNIKEIAF